MKSAHLRPISGALRDAIVALSEPARQQLYTLMSIGQGHLSAKQQRRGLAEVARLGAEAIGAVLAEAADLHDHLVKGLYEADAV